MLVYVLFNLGQLSYFHSCFGAGVTNLNEPPSSLLLPPRYWGLGAGSIPLRAIVMKRCDGSVSSTYRFQTCPGVGDLPRRRPTRPPILGFAAPGLPTTYPESPTPRPKKPGLGRWDDLPRDPVLPGTVLGRADRRPYAPPPNHGVPRLHCGWGWLSVSIDNKTHV